MSQTPQPHVKIIAVGVENYSDLPTLRGPTRDVSRLKSLLVESTDTALYSDEQFIELIDPTAKELRDVIDDYVLHTNITPEGNILIFYFSGHGAPIGGNDFGLCTIDSAFHPTAECVLPLSVVKFSDFLQTISIGNVTPIVIIDACYSGIAGRAIYNTPPIDVISGMRDELHNRLASKYALLCSCSEIQNAIDTSDGGIFSYYLIEIAGEGVSSIKVEKNFLGLHDIFPQLEQRVLSYTGNVTPRLYIGPTLPDFPLVKNVKYQPRSYSLTPHLVKIIQALWNNGVERELSPNEILEICGRGAYGNHNKLDFAPWQLVEDNPETKRRRLSERGREFVLGQLSVPKKVEEDPKTGNYHPAIDTSLVTIEDFHVSDE